MYMSMSLRWPMMETFWQKLVLDQCKRCNFFPLECESQPLAAVFHRHSRVEVQADNPTDLTPAEAAALSTAGPPARRLTGPSKDSKSVTLKIQRLRCSHINISHNEVLQLKIKFTTILKLQFPGQKSVQVVVLSHHIPVSRYYIGLTCKIWHS